MAEDRKRRREQKARKKNRPAPPPPPPKPAWKQAASYTPYKSLLEIEDSPNNRVEKNMPQVDERMLNLMAAATLLGGQKVQVNSGYRDYHVPGSWEGSRHKIHVAVDLDWDNLPGKTNSQKAENLANIAAWLFIKDVYITTKDHGDGAHAHVQIGPLGLGEELGLHNSNQRFDGKGERTHHYAEEQLRKAGFTEENIIKAFNKLGPDGRRDGAYLATRLGIAKLFGKDMETLEQERHAALLDNAQKLAKEAGLDTPESVLDVHNQVLGKNKPGTELSAAKVKAYQAFLALQDIDPGPIDGTLSKKGDGKTRIAAKQFEKIPGGQQKFAEAFFKEPAAQTAPVQTAAAQDSGFLKKLSNLLSWSTPAAEPAKPAVQVADAKSVPPNPVPNATVAAVEKPSTPLPKARPAAANAAVANKLPNPASVVTTVSEKAGATKPPVTLSDAAKLKAEADRKKASGSVEVAAKDGKAVTQIEPARPAAASVRPAKVDELKAAEIKPVEATERTVQSLPPAQIAGVVKKTGLSAFVFGRVQQEMMGVLGEKKSYATKQNLEKVRAAMASHVGDASDDKALATAFGDKVEAFQKTTGLTPDKILGMKTTHKAVVVAQAQKNKTYAEKAAPSPYTSTGV